MSRALLSIEYSEANPISPEQRLLLAVILSAAQEGVGRGSAITAHTRDRDISAARQWFDEAGEDFRNVCSLAGLEPDFVRKAALSYFEQTDANPGCTVRRMRRSDRRPIPKQEMRHAA
jgi:hypothetical protein